MNKGKESNSLKDEILNKILGVIDDKQKTHDSILFGSENQLAGSGGSLV